MGPDRDVDGKPSRRPSAAATRSSAESTAATTSSDSRTSAAAAFSQHLLGPRGADDRARDVRRAQHPGERELGHRQAGLVGDRAQALHRVERLRAQQAAHEAAHRARGAGVGGRRLAAAVLAGQHALGERRPDDLADPVPRAEREDLALGHAVERGVLGLAADEARHARDLERPRDRLHRPLAEADEARLARLDDLGQRAHRLLERDGVVVAVALVEVHVVDPQPRERGVDLLEDLRAREAAVVPGPSGRTPSWPARRSRADRPRGSPPTRARPRRGRRRWRCRRT